MKQFRNFALYAILTDVPHVERTETHLICKRGADDVKIEYRDGVYWVMTGKDGTKKFSTESEVEKYLGFDFESMIHGLGGPDEVLKILSNGMEVMFDELNPRITDTDTTETNTTDTTDTATTETTTTEANTTNTNTTETDTTNTATTDTDTTNTTTTETDTTNTDTTEKTQTTRKRNGKKSE